MTTSMADAERGKAAECDAIVACQRHDAKLLKTIVEWAVDCMRGGS